MKKPSKKLTPFRRQITLFRRSITPFQIYEKNRSNPQKKMSRRKFNNMGCKTPFIVVPLNPRCTPAPKLIDGEKWAFPIKLNFLGWFHATGKHVATPGEFGGTVTSINIPSPHPKLLPPLPPEATLAPIVEAVLWCQPECHSRRSK